MWQFALWFFVATAVDGGRPHESQASIASFLHRDSSGADSHSQHQQCVIPPGMRKARLLQGFEMVVFDSKDIVSQDIQQRGKWEIESAAAMASRVHTSLPSKGVFLDIGANLGYYSFLFAHEGWEVLAVEPMERNRAAMNATLCLNPRLRDKVTLVATALAAPWQTGSMSCVVKSTSYDRNIGNGAIHCGAGTRCQRGDHNCQAIALTTLDSMLTEFAPHSVDVVKMDVETFECFVLQGGKTLFTKYVPKLLQVETQWKNASKCVAEVASDHGYSSHNLGADTTLVHPSLL
mmetsp:Transcript_36795/g.84751  ORF Transcript_36795/g.84751 Transcript_36795/m.84751 type:complete len:291 (+) Transcript_36795:155-1027(+)